MSEPTEPLLIHILCLPESAGSALYGMVDVLSATGILWRELTGTGQLPAMIMTKLISRSRDPFTCANRIPVTPECTFGEVPSPGIVIVPELWLSPDDAVADRYDDVKRWLRNSHDGGAIIYSACSGSVLLAASGLLDGRNATSHWGYEDLFRRHFPAVRFNPAPTLCIGDTSGRIVTAGGTTSWHDLAIHIISRHVSPGEALRIAQVYLMKWHAEGQLPYAALVKRLPHADGVVRRAEDWLADNFRDPDPVAGVVAFCQIPDRSLKRRFRAATGTTLINYAQNLRIEAAKRLLEESRLAIDEIAVDVGYENVAFFRRLFKRSTGLSPGEYRRMFQPLLSAAN
ncbi:GlxA family transcriptional regulator [Roseibium sp.]|uniref:GlxA family transcriptional regulator n=1 Tax=Roseibium sp. TaxID=1936156 RepID=UPI003D121649